MSTGCTLHHCHYAYQASAYGLAGETERPVKHSVSAQAACTLSHGGGRGTHETGKFCLNPFFYYDASYCEVNGSFDDCHNYHTTSAHSVVEGLNIADIVTADRVVSNMVIYSPTHKEIAGEQGFEEDEHSFDITGSYFENLRIAGYKIDIQLATHKFHHNDTYSKFQETYLGPDGAELLPWGKLDEKKLDDLKKEEKKYHALKGTSNRAEKWGVPTTATAKKKQPAATPTRPTGGLYLCSAAGNLEEKLKGTELKVFGGIILVPKFGVIRLAQMLVGPDYRRLSMFQVEMCSGMTGTSDGGSTGRGSPRPLP